MREKLKEKMSAWDRKSQREINEWEKQRRNVLNMAEIVVYESIRMWWFSEVIQASTLKFCIKTSPTFSEISYLTLHSDFIFLCLWFLLKVDKAAFGSYLMDFAMLSCCYEVEITPVGTPVAKNYYLLRVCHMLCVIRHILCLLYMIFWNVIHA